MKLLLLIIIISIIIGSILEIIKHIIDKNTRIVNYNLYLKNGNNDKLARNTMMYEYIISANTFENNEIYKNYLEQLKLDLSNNRIIDICTTKNSIIIEQLIRNYNVSNINKKERIKYIDDYEEFKISIKKLKETQNL